MSSESPVPEELEAWKTLPDTPFTLALKFRVTASEERKEELLHRRPTAESNSPQPLSTDTGVDLLRKEVADLRLALAAVENELLLTEAYNASLQNSSSLIGTRMPPELLSHIFDLGTEQWDPAFPTYVSCVSSHWRAVALATPALWASIAINSPEYTERVRTWLVRARACPLEIDIRYQSRSTPDDFIAAMNLIRPYLSSCARLSAASWDYDCMRHVIGACTGDAPMLEYLRFQTRYPDRASDQEPLTAFEGGNIPRLRSLYLSHVALRWTGEIYTGLTDLTIMSLDSRDNLQLKTLFSLLKQAVNLQSLSLEGGNTLENAPSTPLDSIDLPHLTSLSLDNIPPAYSVILLTSLTTPALARLHIISTDEDDVSGIFSALSASTCTSALTHFTFIEGSCANIDVLEALRNMPLLESVELKGSPAEGFYFLSYTYPTDGRWLCPRMRALAISPRQAGSPSFFLALRRVVEARQQAKEVATLDALSGEFEPNIVDEEWFRRNVANFTFTV
ncbi:hypothetical protein BOTBODRAFT_37961, partial [Botryobasidium botryosum FD-172 SS1]